MTDSQPLKSLDETIRQFHSSIRDSDHPPVVTGWVVAYVAVDGDGADVTQYAIGEGTNSATAVGLLEWAKNHILNRRYEGDDDE